MFRVSCVSAALLTVALACGGKQTALVQGSDEEPVTAPSPCEGKPIPPHECVGGVRTPRCNVVGGESRWQIDCVPRDPSSAPDTRGVSNCGPSGCGLPPTWETSDCVHGFAGTDASCESYDGAACMWTRRCLPKPCSVDEGTCDVVNRDRLGAPCGGGTECPAGQSCATVHGDVGTVDDPVCVADPCGAITCAAGKKCSVLESEPLMIVCSTGF